MRSEAGRKRGRRGDWEKTARLQDLCTLHTACRKPSVECRESGVVNYLPVKVISITIISDLPAVRTGGPHRRIPLVTKKWVFLIFL